MAHLSSGLGAAIELVLLALRKTDCGIRWALKWPFLTAQIVFVCLAAWGGVGTSLGLERLIWSEDWWRQFWNGAAIGWLFAVVLQVRYLQEIDPKGPSSSAPATGSAATAPDGAPHGARQPHLVELDVWRSWPIRLLRTAVAGGQKWYRRGCALSLFPQAKPAIRAFGGYLIRGWAVLFVLLMAVKVLIVFGAGDELDVTAEGQEPTSLFAARNWLIPLAAGYAASIAFARLLYSFDQQLNVRAWIADSRLFRQLPAFQSEGRVRLEHQPLHAIGVFASLITFLVFLAAVALPFPPNPVVHFCCLLILFNGCYTVVSFHVRAHCVFGALVAAWVLWWALPDERMAFPGLEDYDGQMAVDISYPASGVDQYRARLDEPASRKMREQLIPSEEPIRAMCERWRAAHPPAPGWDSRPKLILIAVSGGGVRSAVWTSVVLDGLEQAMPGGPGANTGGFRQHVRLITGASGGMVGAALYAADFEQTPAQRADRYSAFPDGEWCRETGLGERAGVLAKDSLSATIKTMLLCDLHGLRAPAWDRGRRLESEWDRNAAEWRGVPRPAHLPAPFSRTFRDLRAAERRGERPSLIFSPVLLEDSRRLLISNLDLEALTHADAARLGTSSEPSTGPGTKPGEHHLPSPQSLSAVEFHRLFPLSDGKFTIGTAARMNATFPIVSPAVSLPTTPRRHAVDAGYTDNYGVHTAAMWVYHNRKALRMYTSGVALIQVRAYRLRPAGLHFRENDPVRTPKWSDPPAGGEWAKRRRDENPVNPCSERLRTLLADRKQVTPSGAHRPAKDETDRTRLLSWLLSPIEGALSARSHTAQFRNDELLMLLSDELNTLPLSENVPFFVATEFEFDADVSLSWYISQQESIEIVKGFYESTAGTPNERLMNPWIDLRVQALRCWFGKGGCEAKVDREQPWPLSRPPAAGPQ